MLKIEKRILLPGNRYFPRQIQGEPQHLMTLGKPLLLEQKKIALFASPHCSGDLLNKGYDLAQILRRYRIPVISGFHSPMEKQLLEIFLNGQQSIIICHARNISNLWINGEIKKRISNGQILQISPFIKKKIRTSGKTAQKRNQIVSNIAETTLIISSKPGGKIKALCQHNLSNGQVVYALESPFNISLFELGVKSVKVSDIPEWLSEQGFHLKNDLEKLPGFLSELV